MPKMLKVGFEGDNLVERIVFKLPSIARYQNATLMLGGTYANMAALTEGDQAGRYYVDLTAELIGTDGQTESYVVIDGEDGERWQSGVLRLSVGEVPQVETQIEQRFPTAIEQMRQEMAAHDAAMNQSAAEISESAEQASAAATKAQDAAAQAANASLQMPIIGSNGNWLLWDANADAYADSGNPSRGEDGAQGVDGAPGKTAYEYAQDGGYTGTEAEFAAKLAAEIPTVLPNPQKLYIDVFGENEALAQRVSYDGRSTQQITIHNREGVAQYVLGQVPSMITWENMLGKPFGTLGQDAVLFEEQTITLDDGSYQISTNAVLEVGASYVVTLDGAASECEGRLLTIEGGSVPYLGNSRIFGGEDTGEDFFVFTIDGLMGLMVYSAPVEATEVTFGLESIASVKRLDEAYLPESVLVTGAQELTDEQKAQVRENIDAAASVLTDDVTGKKYRLCVSGGELRIEEME